MESSRSQHLTPRRRIHTSTSFEPTMREFMKMEINFDKVEPISEKKADFSPKKNMTLRERSISTIREYQVDKFCDARRRAFDVAFERKAAAKKRQLEKEWSESERMRNWANSKQKTSLRRTPKTNRTQDRQVLEKVIHERNAYYLGSAQDPSLPPPPTTRHTRALPREMTAVSALSARPMLRSKLY